MIEVAAKRNILHIIESSETGGAETVFLRLIEKMDNSYFVPFIGLLYRGWLYDEFRKKGYDPSLLSNKKGGFDHVLLLALLRYIRRYRIELIHSHLFTTNLYSSVAGRLCRIPTISTFHGTMDVNTDDRFKKLKLWLINRCSTRTVYVSNYLRNYFLENGLGSQRNSVVIYNGIDLEDFEEGKIPALSKSKMGLAEDDFVVGCIGDVRPPKDYETLVFTAQILRREMPNVRFVVAGTKTSLGEHLERLVSELGLEEHVFFIGYRDDIREIIGCFDLYLSTSISEGFSLTVVEAMASGIPVVATRSGGPEEIITHNKNGILVDVKSPEQIARAIKLLFQDIQLRSNLASEASKEVRNGFGLSIMIKRYEQIYKSILERGSLQKANESSSPSNLTIC
jgi:glycosyltransferase involved in cell wall biosynthesis